MVNSWAAVNGLASWSRGLGFWILGSWGLGYWKIRDNEVGEEACGKACDGEQGVQMSVSHVIPVQSASTVEEASDTLGVRVTQLGDMRRLHHQALQG